MLNPFKKWRLSDVPAAKLSFSRSKQLARILVIDDDERAFPTKLLRDEGYNVHYWECIRNLKDLESGSYDIIVLDINDVASPEISARDGLGVLLHLKKNNPGQLIIAYSGKTYDITHEEFWRLADDSLGKPSDLLTCKAKIDRLIESKFTTVHYWGILAEAMRGQGVESRALASVEDQLARALSKGAQVDVNAVMSGLRLSKETVALAGTLITVICRIVGEGSR